MASHQAGRGRDERAGAEDFESGLDYGAFVEDDAADDPNRTQAPVSYTHLTLPTKA